MIQRIKTQVEYYFSDKNYPHDKYLQTASKRRQDKYIPLKEILAFNKVRKMKPDLLETFNSLFTSTTIETQMIDDTPMVRWWVN